MRVEALQIAISEAKIFLVRANRVRLKDIGKFKEVDQPSKETAACKRASMDLTRALAELRKP